MNVVGRRHERPMTFPAALPQGYPTGSRSAVRRFAEPHSIEILGPISLACGQERSMIFKSAILKAHSFFGGPSLGLRTTQLIPQLIVILLISLGEEFGWRGFALPRLQERFSALNASLVLGLVRGFWHFPGFLVGAGVPLNMPFGVFLLWIILATILITWVYNNTGGSILSAILMHSAANATFNYLPLLPEFVGQMTTFVIFLGLIFVVTLVVIALNGAKRLVR
jgi:membrane protease YdiL (CAAX protease family)